MSQNKFLHNINRIHGKKLNVFQYKRIHFKGKKLSELCPADGNKNILLHPKN